MAIEDVFPKLIAKKCEICEKTSDLFRCTGCRVYFYCGRDHQSADREVHKSTCNEIKKARKKAQAEENKLREHPGDDDTPKDIFDTHMGRMSLWRGARPYLTALFNISATLVRSYRREGVDEALEAFLNLLKLDRGDKMTARMIIPALFLRLGHDQECYDFLKWWAIKFHDPKGYDWYNMEEPYLNIRDADIMEPVDLWTKNGQACPNLPHAVCLTLVKIRVLQNLQGVDKFREHLGPGMTSEELLAYEPLRSQLRGEWILSRPELVNEGAIEANIETVADQVKELLTVISESNKHMLPMLMEPSEANLLDSLKPYEKGSEAEAELALQNTYPAWCETEGSIQGMRNVFLSVISPVT